MSCAACGGRWQADGTFVPFEALQVVAESPASRPSNGPRAAERLRRRRIVFLAVGIAVFDCIVGVALVILYVTGALG